MDNCNCFLEKVSKNISCLLNVILAVFIPIGIGSSILNPYLKKNKITLVPSLDSLTVMFSIGLFLTLLSLAALYYINHVFFQIKISKRTKNFIDMVLIEGALFGSGFSVFFYYSQKNNFFPSISYNLLLSVVAISLLFLLTSYVMFCLLKKFIKNISPKTIIIINIILLVGTIASNGLASPQSIVKLLGFGNYQATLFLTEKACESLSNIPGLSISPQRGLENIHVVWGLGERWFIEVNAEDDQKMLILKKDCVSKAIIKE